MLERPCIVVQDGQPMQLSTYPDTPRDTVLTFGKKATVFGNRRQARRAIARSTAYSRRHDLGWATWGYRVVNLTAVGPRILRVAP